MLQTQTKMNPVVRPGQKGFSLIETMIALGIIGIISLAVTQFIAQSNDEALKIETKTQQTQASNALMRTVSRMDTLKRSMGKSGNADFTRCMDVGPGSLSGACTAIDKTSPKYFNLYANERRIAGTASNPVLYNRIGAVCQGGETYCPVMSATASFYVTCSLDKAGKPMSSCEQAANMVVKVEMTPNPKYAEKLNLKATSFSIMHQVSEKSLGGSQDCPLTGQEFKGILPSGKIDCKCRTGFDTIYNTDGSIKECKGIGIQQCGDGELMRGRKANGQPICAKATIRCFNIDFDGAGKCDGGGWLEKIDLGVCRPKKVDKKAETRNIECDKNDGRCCRYDF